MAPEPTPQLESLILERSQLVSLIATLQASRIHSRDAGALEDRIRDLRNSMSNLEAAIHAQKQS